jgi:hypothetical protein
MPPREVAPPLDRLEFGSPAWRAQMYEDGVPPVREVTRPPSRGGYLDALLATGGDGFSSGLGRMLRFKTARTMPPTRRREPRGRRTVSRSARRAGGARSSDDTSPPEPVAAWGRS